MSRRRRQRVVLRTKQRVVLKQRMRQVFIGGIVAGLLVAFGMQVVSSSNAWAPRYIKQHTPSLEMRAPEMLADLPVLKESPPSSFAIWFPGAGARLRRKWLKQYPVLRDVRFEKEFLANRVIVRFEPREPLVRWEGQAMDKDGVLFALDAQRVAALPKAVVASSEALSALGRWLSEVARHSEFWSQVVAVSQDPRGEMWLSTQTGTQVAWGPPDIKRAKEKARALAVVLEDAHQRLSGAAAADVRFFEEGRIIVRPKSAV